MKYTALHMSATKDNDFTKEGFDTFLEADLYICGFLCTSCKSDYDSGCHICEDLDGSIETYIVEYAVNTDCGAEWMIEEIE